MKLTVNDMNAVIMVNFNVQNETFTLDFPITDKLYEYFTQDSVDLSSNSASYSFSPSEYQLYTTKRIKSENVYVEFIIQAT